MIHYHAPSDFEAKHVEVQAKPGKVSFEPQFAGAKSALAGYLQVDEAVYRLEITPAKKLRVQLLTAEPADEAPNEAGDTP